METQNYEQYSIDLCNRLLLSAIGIKIQRNQVQEELQAFLRREACSAPAMSHSRGTGWHGALCVWHAATLPSRTQPLTGRAPETKARDTCFCGDTANPIRVRGLFAQGLAVGQDAFHAADFTANSTAWHGLEVHAVSQGLRSKFL